MDFRNKVLNTEYKTLPKFTRRGGQASLFFSINLSRKKSPYYIYLISFYVVIQISRVFLSFINIVR